MTGVKYLVESLELEDGQIQRGVRMTGDLADRIEAIEEIILKLDGGLRQVLVPLFQRL